MSAERSPRNGRIGATTVTHQAEATIHFCTVIIPTSASTETRLRALMMTMKVVAEEEMASGACLLRRGPMPRHPASGREPVHVLGAPPTIRVRIWGYLRETT